MLLRSLRTVSIGTPRATTTIQGRSKLSHVDGDRERGEAGADATRTLAMMMLSLYQVLQLSKAIDKDAASGAGK